MREHQPEAPKIFPKKTTNLKKNKREKKSFSERKEEKKVNIKFNNVLVLISIIMLSGSTQVYLTRGSGVKSLHPPAGGIFSQALLTITQLFALKTELRGHSASSSTTRRPLSITNSLL